MNGSAQGGSGGNANTGNAGDGGNANLMNESGFSVSTVYGKSTGAGSTSVRGRVDGGHGGAATGDANAGNGAGVSLNNAVNGDSAGQLSLAQIASSGWLPISSACHSFSKSI